QRALTLAGLERPGEALEDFLELSRRRPEKVESWANAGMILLRMERYAEAIPHLRRAAQMSPANMQLRRSLANALSGNGALAAAPAAGRGGAGAQAVLGPAFAARGPGPPAPPARGRLAGPCAAAAKRSADGASGCGTR